MWLLLRRCFFFDGIINWIFYEYFYIFLKFIWIDGLVGVIIVQIIIYYLIVYFNVYVSFINIDFFFEEQVENFGSKGFYFFRMVIFLFVFLGIMSGVIFVGIFSFEDFVVLIVFQGSLIVKKFMFYQIYSFFVLGFVIGNLQMVVLVLVMFVLVVIMFFVVRWYVGFRQYVMFSKGGRWNLRVVKFKWWQVFFIVFVVVLVFFIMVFLQIGVFFLVFFKSWYGIWLSGFMFDNMKVIIIQLDIERVIINSFMYLIVVVFIIILFFFILVYVFNRFKKVRFVLIIDSFVMILIVVFGIVIVMSYFFFFLMVLLFKGSSFDFINLLEFFFGVVLILVYLIRCLFFVVCLIFVGLQQVYVFFEEVVMNLGVGRWKVFISVIILMIYFNFFGGVMFSFVYCMSEISVGIIFGLINLIWYLIIVKMKEFIIGVVGSVNFVVVFGVFFMVVQIMVIVIVNLIIKQRYFFIGLI